MSETIGGFEVLSRGEIEGGGMDLRARRTEGGEEVRLWVGAAGRVGAADGGPEEMVRRLSKVYQTGLPRVVEGFVHDDRAVIVVQAYKGTPLEERLAQGPFPIVEALDIAKSIGAALAKAHAQQVVHGHVDERAIFLHEDGRALLLYLGLAPFLNLRSPRAPEDLAEPSSETSDVFGLSRVLVRMVTGTDPMRRVDAGEERAALASGRSPSAADFPEQLPEGLRRLLARAVHHDRSERIRRAEELAGDLRVLRASWDSIAKQPEKPLPFPRMGRILVAGLLVALAAVALSLVRGCVSRSGFPG